MKRVRSCLTVLAALALPAAAAAQGGRVALTPFVGRAMSSPIFEHAARFVLNYPVGGGQGQQVTQSTERRLELDDALVLGARFETRVGRAWTAFAEGAFGRTEFAYFDSLSMVGSGANPIAMTEVARSSGRAKVEHVALALGRRFAPWRPELELGIGVGASLQRFELTKGQVVCAPGFECPVTPWEETYSIPGVAGSLSLRWALGPWAGLEAQSLFTAGRADVESLSRGCDGGGGSGTPPCAAGHRWVRGMQLSLGLSIRP